MLILCVLKRLPRVESRKNDVHPNEVKLWLNSKVLYFKLTQGNLIAVKLIYGEELQSVVFYLIIDFLSYLNFFGYRKHKKD